MRYLMLRLVEIGVGLFALSGLTAFAGYCLKKKSWQETGLRLLPIIGPITLAVCWFALNQYRVEETLFWSRLMAGDAARWFSLGSLGLIAGSGLALGTLALGERKGDVLGGAFFVACLWIFLYLHPTPHYVPMPEWADKTIWFGLLVGGAITSVVVYHAIRPFLRWVTPPLLCGVTLLALLSLLSLAAHLQAGKPLILSRLEAKSRIQAAGCLACHTQGGEGRSLPGGGLESVASRAEDVVKAFLQKPDAESARKFGIRDQPTGEMAGLHLTEEQVASLVDAMKILFTIKPPTLLGPGFEKVEAVLTEKTCLACHTLKDLGAPGGGIGGPLEQTAKFSEDILKEWLLDPSAEKAKKLGIREQPMGAMASFRLTEENATLTAKWLKSLPTEK